MPVRVYKCLKCQQVSQVEFQPGSNPRCKCGSEQLKRVAFDASATTVARPVVVPPTVVTPGAPVVPPAPTGPMAAAVKKPVNPAHQAFLAQQAKTKPSGQGLLAELRASNVGVLDPTTGARTVNRNRMDNRAYQRYWEQARTSLPRRDDSVAGTQAAVADVIRCVVADVKKKSIANVEIDFMYQGRKYYLPARVTVDLTLPLAELAAGKCRPYEHGRSNTEYGNRQSDLPFQVGDEDVSYLEFGWRYRIPASAVVMRGPANRRVERVPVLDANHQAVGAQRETDIYNWIRANNCTVEAGLRLVISDWGYLFFTSTHYRSFLIYDHSHEEWRPYTTYSRNDSADASWYDRGEQNANWILPVTAPGYW
jgi:hypothetical protein